MFELLRLARVARTLGGLVGGFSSPAFRAFALVVTCAGLGFTLAGPGPVAVFIAAAVFVIAWSVRHSFSRRRTF